MDFVRHYVVVYILYVYPLKTGVTDSKTGIFWSVVKQPASKIDTMWGPQDSVQLVHITPITMVYRTCNYSYWGL